MRIYKDNKLAKRVSKMRQSSKPRKAASERKKKAKRDFARCGMEKFLL